MAAYSLLFWEQALLLRLLGDSLEWPWGQSALLLRVS
jgi:hypothetical protein